MQIKPLMDTHMCTCGPTSALKRKMHTMMFMKSKFNFKCNERFGVNTEDKIV